MNDSTDRNTGQYDRTDKRLLAVQVEEALMEFILQEPLEIGEKIPNEFRLAEMFGVGRSTVREAVKILVSRGILEVRRGSGTYVAATATPENDPLGLSRLPDKFKLALELFDVRLLLEPEIAALAAEFATQEDLEELVRLCDETERMYRSGENHISEDVAFHTWIGRCSKNRVIETLIPVINTAVMTFANLTRRTLMQETIETHRAIVNAILDRDPVGARCAMVMHLTYNRQALIRQSRERLKQKTDE